MKQVIFTEDAPKAVGPYSQAILHGSTLYASGQIPINPKTNEVELSTPKGETKIIMENLKAVLAQANMDFNHVVKVSIFLTDMNAFAEVNEVYAAYFEKDPPARETIQVAALPKGAQVEISLVSIK